MLWYVCRVHVFFCHAGEDKAVVEQVYQRVGQAFPDVEGWLDKYQIVAGQDLIEKIADGIEKADKFLVFLSEQSIDKPWVKAELRKALMEEITGIKSDFIVPVKLGPISKVPPFIESKRYIDLDALTEPLWLKEFEGVIRGAPVDAAPAQAENLEVMVGPVDDLPDAVVVIFKARYWAEDVSFGVETNAPIQTRSYRMLDAPLGGHAVNSIEQHPHVFAVQLPKEKLQGGKRFAMIMSFPQGTDLPSVIKQIGPWDGRDADSVVGMRFA
jgi:hypothetical protein